jgi:hypothetical protein
LGLAVGQRSVGLPRRPPVIQARGVVLVGLCFADQSRAASSDLVTHFADRGLAPHAIGGARCCGSERRAECRVAWKGAARTSPLLCWGCRSVTGADRGLARLALVRSRRPDDVNGHDRSPSWRKRHGRVDAGIRGRLSQTGLGGRSAKESCARQDGAIDDRGSIGDHGPVRRGSAQYRNRRRLQRRPPRREARHAAIVRGVVRPRSLRPCGWRGRRIGGRRGIA